MSTPTPTSTPTTTPTPPAPTPTTATDSSAKKKKKKKEDDSMKMKVFTVQQLFPTLASRASKYRKPVGIKLRYGTAGFRMKAAQMRSTAFRMGMLAILRSRVKDDQAIGLCLTASHNPDPDNGIKIADPDGSVLHASWEEYATRLANADNRAVAWTLQQISKKEKILNVKGDGVVFLARDTRSSGPKLAECAREGVLMLRGSVVDYGVMTTPQLHHMVRMWNKGERDAATESGYFERLAKAYAKLVATGDAKSSSARVVVLDGAYGVGAKKCELMQAALDKESANLQIDVRNNVKEGKLNHLAGADHVYRKKMPPAGFKFDKEGAVRAASFDGDADRVVYHYFAKDSGRFVVLDGDKIASLLADFLGKEVARLGLAAGSEDALTLAIVQNSYANGASTSYMQDKMKVRVEFGKTGVKHLHHKAAKFDIGVYFEANGHGTVLFSEKFDRVLKKIGASATGDRKEAVERLSAARKLMNQAVGDAFSDLLMVEAILSIRGWTVVKWDGIYTDTPSRQETVKVPDRTVVKPNDTERRVLAPDGLQDAIDALVKGAGKNARAFVRPSGTEDIVRVYAEAATQDGANKLADAVSEAVRTFAGKEKEGEALAGLPASKV